MDTRIKNSIYGVECFKRQELCKLCLDCRYDILSLDSIQKVIRDGKLCVMATSTLGSVPSVMHSKRGYQLEWKL